MEVLKSRALDHLIQAAKTNTNKLGILNAIGEIEINGVVYQIQLYLNPDKKLWVKKDAVRFQEITKYTISKEGI